MQSPVEGGKSPRKSKSKSRKRRSHSRTVRSLQRRVRRLSRRLRRSPSTRYVILPRRTEYKYVTPYYYGYNKLAAEYTDQRLKDVGYQKRPEYRGYECTKGRYDSGLCASGVFPYNPLTGRNEDPHTRTSVGGGRPGSRKRSRSRSRSRSRRVRGGSPMEIEVSPIKMIIDDSPKRSKRRKPTFVNVKSKSRSRTKSKSRSRHRK